MYEYLIKVFITHMYVWIEMISSCQMKILNFTLCCMNSLPFWNIGVCMKNTFQIPLGIDKCDCKSYVNIISNYMSN